MVSFEVPSSAMLDIGALVDFFGGQPRHLRELP